MIQLGLGLGLAQGSGRLPPPVAGFAYRLVARGASRRSGPRYRLARVRP